MIGNKHGNVQMISPGTWVPGGLIVLAVLTGVLARGYGGGMWVFGILLLSAAIVGLAQQTLP